MRVLPASSSNSLDSDRLAGADGFGGGVGHEFTNLLHQLGTDRYVYSKPVAEWKSNSILAK
jgi:hypothetical protein